MSEKNLALLGSAVGLVLISMSAVSLIMVASVRTDMSSYAKTSTQQAELIQAQDQQVKQLQAIVAQLKENQLAMLPLLSGTPLTEEIADGSPPVNPQEGAGTTLDPVVTEPAATPEKHPPVAANTQADMPRGSLGSTAPVKSLLQMGPAAPVPVGVRVFPAGGNSFVAPVPEAAESGAPQANIAAQGDTILAALQTPVTGLKSHPVLEQIKQPALVESPSSKPLENVDGILVQHIVANWKRPPSARSGMAVEIVIKMSRDGAVRSAQVVSSSGDKGFDRSATTAIKAVKPIREMSRVSDEAYNRLYRERRVKFSPEDLAG
ncbi:TonB family protein [Pseudomonas violetae]|uniref:TonB family protein n=1 Tax=Pseudomonas violetae TaxID=2915813 RepID=A0ABT0ETR8_9PSED|nr:TonB family protein [Pseudomonas violetae]